MAQPRGHRDVAPEESTFRGFTNVDPDIEYIQRQQRSMSRRERSARDLRSRLGFTSTPDEREEAQDLRRQAVTTTQREERPLSGPDSRPREEGRSTEDVMKIFTTSIASLLDRFTEVSKQPKFNQNNIETYEGRVEEDPDHFVEVIEHHIRRQEIREDTDKTAFFRAQLRGEARRWADGIRHAPVPYHTFVLRFLDEFNSPRRQVKAYHRFYAETQKKEETAEEFITFKQALLSRLKPNMSTETTIEMIISLLKPALSSRIIGTRPSTVEELVRVARLIEQEVEREYRCMPAPRHSSPRRQQPQQEVPRRQAQENLRRNDVPGHQGYQPRGPSTPCRWCQGWHYSDTCRYQRMGPANANFARDSRPTFTLQQQRQQPTPTTNNNRQDQGNSKGASGPTTTTQPTRPPRRTVPSKEETPGTSRGGTTTTRPQQQQQQQATTRS